MVHGAGETPLPLFNTIIPRDDRQSLEVLERFGLARNQMI